MNKSQRKLWIAFTIVMLFSFGVLGYYGIEIYQEAPPVPIEVRTNEGQVVLVESDIKDGQNVWQSIGGQEVGSIWGHGAYVAPDWTADYLHREALFLLDYFAKDAYGQVYDAIGEEEQAALQARLQRMIRSNTYDKATGVLTITAERNQARLYLENYYSNLFSDDPAFDQLRKDYAIPTNAIKDETRLKQMGAFFFWATWATVTNRPGSDISYTHNWPADDLVGNKATTPLLAWSGVSIILLIFAVGVLVYYHVVSRKEEEELIPVADPVSNGVTTKSMTMLKKYFWVVCLLMLLQVGLGIITAHYGVEGQGLYGIPIDQILPYSVTRTWHTQLAIFWIATAWLGTGLYIAPAVGGKDPKFQVFGVNFLFVALLIIVLGSMIGQWFGIMQKLNLVQNFWFGHQGYEYVDLGRFWQLFLFVGLFVWLALMIRPLIPVLKKRDGHRNLIILFLISCGAIALFYGAGLMWGRQTNLAIAEYWRWWVVHLWVEGFFEVFATVVLAFLFVRMGLLKTKTATNGALLSTIIFMSGGIIGTFHHLYFSGTPTAVMALGATFSALEVVPLTLIGYEAYENYKISKHKGWLQDYKWPIYFMVAVAFWNFLGAGVFGFIINPPIALYYVQGLNTTPLHGHTALFGVYGMLGIGLMLFVLRSMYREVQWNEKLLKIGFWGLNIGLLLMALLSLLPIGIWQAVESIQHGMWYARSSELMQLPAMNTLKWLRTIGDVIFTVGIFAIVLFVFKLTLKKIIMKNRTIGSFVAEDFRTAAIFNKHGIDFCCKGGRTIDEVCEKKTLNAEELVSELERLLSQQAENNIDFRHWPLDLLADYIEKTHHRYIEEKIPVLVQFLNKLSKVHGERHPELFEINELFLGCAQELSQHLKKEELILFPFVRKMVSATITGQPIEVPQFGTVENPVAMMMHEHDSEGERFRKIAALSNNYTPPADGCNTYKVAYAMLKEFEEDLHKHIHLENNILFPSAIALEQKMN